MKSQMIRVLAAVAATLLTWPAELAAQTVTTLVRNGPAGAKHNLVIIGDGFTAADQAAYNQFVNDVVLRDLFSETAGGVYAQTMGAFNIYRINANSTESGITTVDATGNVTNTVNTFLGYRFSGSWNRCWMEPGPNTNTTLNNTLNNLVPGWDYAFIILNTTSFGGCRRGNNLAITMGGSWTVAAHEMGHLVGNLGDEYSGSADYTGAEPDKVNLTVNTKRATLKWNQFVNPGTPIPTDASTFTGSTSDDAGLFAGATTGGTKYGTGIYRPAVRCRMNSNAQPFCPICYDQMQHSCDGQMDRAFRKVYPGRFNSDQRDDVVLLNGNTLSLYTGAGDQLNQTWCRTRPDPVWDAYRPGDEFFVGDFDGDGIDDLFVFNTSDWSMPYVGMLRGTGSGFEGVRRFDGDLPGWGPMRAHDKFFVADVNGDGKSDLLVFNGQDWAVSYLLVLRSSGNDLQFVKRFDDTLPGWDSMKKNDQFFVADFDADKRDDLYIFNGADWSMGYLQMLRSGGTDFNFVRRYDNELPAWDAMKSHDQFYVADVDGDGRRDLYVFNGPDWSMSYLEMMRSTGKELQGTRRFDGDVPGWGGMRAHDRWFVADLNGDHREDLYVYNADDWVTEYLGAMSSNGHDLSGGWQADWIGSWNLGKVDRFRVANFNGGSGWKDLIVFNDHWLGLLRSNSGSESLSAIYRDWIHNHNYHALGWW